VLACAWYARVWLALGLALALTVGRLGLYCWVWEHSCPAGHIALNAVLRFAALAALAVIVVRSHRPEGAAGEAPAAVAL
jgi:hypothetical protein